MGAMRSHCRIVCPKCHSLIREPFSRFSGPVPFVHHVPRCHARLIVHPNPTGHNHTVLRVPHKQSLEDALDYAVAEAFEQERVA
jgi:hypothetical protein